MTLLETLNNDMKQAMKDKDKAKLSVIRMVKSALTNEQISLGKDLTEDDEMTVLSREVKQRNESLAEYQNGNREDLADQVTAELAILQAYLPEQLTESELDQLVSEAIAKTGAEVPKDMGKVMGMLSAQTKGRADGKLVSEKVKAALA